MKTINPKCTNENSFKYSILILLHYYDFNKNRERINQLNKYIKNYKFEDTNYFTFERDNPNISFIVYDENHNLIHKSINNSNKKAYIVKINNNNRYHALKPIKYKYKQLEKLLKQFTHKELTEFVLRKVTC